MLAPAGQSLPIDFSGKFALLAISNVLSTLPPCGGVIVLWASRFH